MQYDKRLKLPWIVMVCCFFATGLSAQMPDMSKLRGVKARSIGPAGMSGRITAIDAVASNPSIIFAGAASGGVWKSVNGGINWDPVFDQESTQSIGAIAIQQDNPAVVWVGTGEGNPRNSANSGDGLYKSLDGGKTWKHAGLENTHNIHRILIDPKNTNTVYVGVTGSPWGDHPERGVFKTTDGGRSWTKVLYVNGKTGIGDMVMDPSNPNKLIAGMWEHRRRPWDFVSGGPGSGLYMTLDGGTNWTRLTPKNGIPEGNLGRIGLAIAASKPDVVYAWIESNKNALYKSTDGGFKWEMMNDKPNDIGTRPFYFCSIYADPKNENRLYTIYSEANVSEDGGKTFQKLLPYYPFVHPDHHAWWISPSDPGFMIDGNDGGVYITRDYGKNWTFAENIPVSQFYHVNVDMEQPYNLFGGLQDNGSYAGPAYVWKNQGIHNGYWQQTMFSDGFDSSPDPDDSRFGYSMSQSGGLGRFDRKTGFVKMLKPTHPDPKMKLRYNWNSGFAQDPFDHSTIYYGSQFLNRSRDKGSTWEVISPDLSTNDTAKIREENGGLSGEGPDTHCTIIAISPSKKEQGVIWTGTDDGQVQLTRNAGKTWTNVTSRIPGMPKGAWIPQVNASEYNGGEVFVVVNNYRQFDYKAYLFHSTDYGQTWESMVAPAQLGKENYTLCMVQDPVEPRLMFVGTENGLFVTFDGGKNYGKWTSGYPASVPTIDMVIHPREHDLVIATFGRSFYILDDIRPLRDMAKSGMQLLAKPVHLFTPPVAYQVEYQNPDGYMFPGNSMFLGENRPAGAMISYVINRKITDRDSSMQQKTAGMKKGGVKKPVPATAPSGSKPVKTDPDTLSLDVITAKGAKLAEQKNLAAKDTVQQKGALAKGKSDSLTLEVFNSQGVKIYTRAEKAPADNGLNRTSWAMLESGVYAPSREKIRPGIPLPDGIDVVPGVYKLRLSFDGQMDSTSVTVKQDPRFPENTAVIRARHAMLKDLQGLTGLASKAMNQLAESKEIADQFQKQLKESGRKDLKDAADQNKAIMDSINALMDYIVGKPRAGQRGGRPSDPPPVTAIGTAQSYISGSKDPVSATDERVFSRAREQMTDVMNRVNAFYQKAWPGYRTMMEKVNISPFKNYESLKITPALQ